MDDLVQLVFFGLLVLFGLLSAGRRKKKSGPAPSQRRKPPRPGQSPTRVGRPDPQGRKPEPEPLSGELVDDFLDLLRGTASKPRHEEPAWDEERSAVDEEAESLEPSGEASHRAFHERYVDPSAPPILRPYADPSGSPILRPYAIERAEHHRFKLAGRNLKDAIVLTEILGPPKALREAERGTESVWSEPIA